MLWLSLERSWELFWYVAVQANPDIVRLKRNSFWLSYKATFNNEWDISVTKEPFSPWYYLEVPFEKSIYGLAFGVAMDLATQIYSSDGP